MDIKQEFLSSILYPLELPSEYSRDYFLGKTYTHSHSSFEKAVLVLAHGDFHTNFSFTLPMNSLNCYMLFYTKGGKGVLHFNDQDIILSAGSLYLLDARHPFSISSNSNMWDFSIYYLKGTNMPLFFSFTENIEQPFFLNSNISLLDLLNRIEKNEISSGERDCVLDIKCFTDLFCDLELMSHSKAEQPQNIPKYLSYMKKCFDVSYDRSYSLQAFEDELQISKYRLCREFSDQFCISPLQYLNLKRIEVAKDLLLSTDLPIHEIGTRVGIENTNHFINVFKKRTGTTPFVYRKKI